jgi:hypothetical protein
MKFFNYKNEQVFDLDTGVIEKVDWGTQCYFIKTVFFEQVRQAGLRDGHVTITFNGDSLMAFYVFSIFSSLSIDLPKIFCMGDGQLLSNRFCISNEFNHEIFEKMKANTGLKDYLTGIHKLN